MTTPLFSDAEALRAELNDLLLTAALPAAVKQTYRDCAQLAGNDAAKLEAIVGKLRARRRHTA